MYHRLQRLVVFLALADAASTQLALLAADFARRVIPLGNPGAAPATYLNPFIHLAAALVFLSTFLVLQVYDVRRDTRPVGDPATLARAVMTATFAFSGALYFTYRDVPRLTVIYFFWLELAALAGTRLLALLVLRLLRRTGRPLSRILLVGAGQPVERVARALRERLGDSVEIAGWADDSAEAGPVGLPRLGGLADVPRLARSLSVDEVILALPAARHSAVEKLAFDLLDQPVRVRLVPDYMRLVIVQSSVESLGGIPFIGLREPRIAGLNWMVKRLFDVVVAGCLALALAPLLLALAALIRLDSPGPAIFRQRRVGENGRLFWMYKYRSMRADADQRADKLPEDERVTRLGRWLRRTSLDELPQLFNVLAGEMSLVGPRPELEHIVERYEPWQRQRLAVPPGMTGWWQVNGRSDLPLHLNTQMDLYYIRNYSLWLDVVILWRTFGVVVSGQGAY